MGPVVALSTISVAPAFFVGALGVDIRNDFGFGTAALGLAISIYFLSTALTTRSLGGFADRVGGHRAGLIAVVMVAGCLIGVAVSPNWWVLAGVLIVGGMGNALAGPTSSLLLARQVPLGTLGLAFGIKQSSVPLAILAAGLAVPLIAANVGWQWVFAIVGALTLLVLFIVPDTPSESLSKNTADPGTRVPRRPMIFLAISFGLVIASVTSLGTLFVDSAVDAGFTAGQGGVILAVGSLAAVVVRVALGFWSDTTTTDVMRLVVAMMAIGSSGYLLISLGTITPLIIGVVVVFGLGWGWSGMFMFAVTRHNMGAPATATGIVQTGAATGGVIGPVSIGSIAEHLGYTPAWLVAGALMALAAAAAMVGTIGLASHVASARQNAPEGQA